MTGAKWCPHCKAERPLTEFYVNKAAASGVDGYCKQYRKERQRQRTRDHQETKRQERVSQGLSPERSRSNFEINDAGRKCTICLAFKTWVEFHLDRNSLTGHQSKCKACVRERQRELSLTEEGREAGRRRTAEYRARQRGPGWQPKQVTRHAQLDCDGVAHTCTQCLKKKPVREFPRNAETPCGFDPRCSDCRHNRRVERRGLNHNDIRLKEVLNWSLTKYGITADEYHWLLDRQQGGCALCGDPEQFDESVSRGKTRLSIDHDHGHCGPGRACKECIRGLLCSSCNFGLGKFEYKERTRRLFDFYLVSRPFQL